MPTIYEIPLAFHEQGLDERVVQRLGLGGTRAGSRRVARTWCSAIVAPRDRVRIAVVGKYTELVDSYKSVQEALIHGGIANDVGVDIVVDLERRLHVAAARPREVLADYHGLLVPGGFGVRGVEGMVEAIRACARDGLAVLRHLPRHADGDHRVRAQRRAGSTTATRASSRPSARIPSSRSWSRSSTSPTWAARCGSARTRAGCARDRAPPRSTASPEVSERHRHRYEVSNNYRDLFVRARAALQRPVARRLARRDDRAADASVVHRLPVPSGAAVAPDAPASAVRRLHRRGREREAAASRAGAPARRQPQARRLTCARSRDDALFLIAGPCVVENDALNLRVGEHLARLRERVPGGIIYKASFDKANRSNAGAARGPGGRRACARSSACKRATGLRVLTDVHLPDQCAPAAEVADVLQIPAFLCRQTDLLEAAGATGKPVNVKKGQWMHPEGMRGAVEKVREPRLSARRAWHSPMARRGPSRGHRARHVLRLRRPRGGHALVRAHARGVRRAGHLRRAPTGAAARRGEGGSSGGAREFIPPLTLAAVAAGADGLFLETHPDPDTRRATGRTCCRCASSTPSIARAVDVWTAVSRVIDAGARATHPHRRPRRRRRADRRRASTSATPTARRSSSSATTSRTAWAFDSCATPASASSSSRAACRRACACARTSSRSTTSRRMRSRGSCRRFSACSSATSIARRRRGVRRRRFSGHGHHARGWAAGRRRQRRPRNQGDRARAA